MRHPQARLYFRRVDAADSEARPGKAPTSRPPSLTPSHPLSSQEHVRVVTSVQSPEPHRGWHSRGYLPHWDHPGLIQSLNFRLGDALPRAVIERWKIELGLLVESDQHPEKAGRKIELRRRIEDYLDAGHGACWLRRDDLAALVENALRHFDGERYRLLAWCVMPNHVHALIETKEGFPLGEVLHSWKSFTSKRANESLHRTGEFWQREFMDRYVRNAEHFAAVTAYIEENPVQARLARVKTEWPWSSARFRGGEHRATDNAHEL